VILGVASTLILLVCSQIVREPSVVPTGDGPSAAGGFVKGEPSSAQGVTLREAIRTREILLIISGSAAAQITSRAIVVHIAPHAMDVGISPFLAAMALSLIGCGSFLGRIVMGVVQDRIGAQLSMIICLTVMGISLFALPLIRSDIAFLGFAILFGLAYGGDVPQTPALTVKCFGVASMGIVYALVAGAANVLSSLGPLAAGYIFDVARSYTIAFLGAGALLFLGAFSVSRIR
jgi:predicted MFS family arabinose efflux permease